MSNILSLVIVLGCLIAVAAVAGVLTWFLDYSPQAKTRAARKEGYQNGYTFGKVWVGSKVEADGYQYEYNNIYTNPVFVDAYNQGFLQGKADGTQASKTQTQNKANNFAKL